METSEERWKDEKKGIKQERRKNSKKNPQWKDEGEKER
jgi:hypothetical protein